MGDVFILGAGFSKAIADLPLARELSHRVLNSLGESAINELRNLLPTFEEDNFEAWLTYLSQNQPWLSEAQNSRKRSLFLEISEKLSNIIGEAQGEFDKRWPEPGIVYVHGGHQEIINTYQATLTSLKETEKKTALFMEFVRYLQENSAEVITLNYDTLVERCWASIFYPTHRDPWGRTYFEYPANFAHPGFSGLPLGLAGGGGLPLPKHFPFYKLHGSLNWFYSGAGTFYGETIFCVRVSAENSGHRSELLRDKVPLVIPPVMEKIPHFQHETIRSLWFQAGQALRNASTVYSIGYSLPETDLTMQFFLKASAPKKRVPFYVVSRNTGGQAMKRYLELLGNVYDVRDKFTGANAIENFVNWLTDSEAKENHGQNSQNHN